MNVCKEVLAESAPELYAIRCKITFLNYTSFLKQFDDMLIAQP